MKALILLLCLSGCMSYDEIMDEAERTGDYSKVHAYGARLEAIAKRRQREIYLNSVCPTTTIALCDMRVPKCTCISREYYMRTVQ